jgi:L-aspartate oxidase
MKYLKKYNPKDLLKYETEILIIGSGVAGLTAALSAAESGCRITLITKSQLNSGSTPHAQGGISSVFSDNDSFKSHLKDTLKAGAGLCNENAVKVLVEEGPNRINDLIDMGMNFDKIDGKIHLTKEAAHSHRRILHSNGDATGKELEFILVRKVLEQDNIKVKEHIFAMDLITEDNICYGCIGYDFNTGQEIFFQSHSTVLAGGGIGEIYRETTNPPEITGDTIAMAYRAGAVLTDMEFIQFHPTTLYIAGAPRFLISESVRGEGAYLLNNKNERFMKNYHKDCELAARDIVSRAISEEMIKTKSPNVFLSLSHLSDKLIENRFPNIRKMCIEYGIDIKKDKIPVRPAEHYFMGGIKAGLHGETNIKNLYACGECSCTGVHGANRLASNSLLEGLVFGYRSGKHAVENMISININFNKLDFSDSPEKKFEVINILDAKNSLKSLMWRNTGIFRNKINLVQAEDYIKKWNSYILTHYFDNAEGYELQNKIIIANLIVKGALRREESRGAHYRTDFPDSKPELKNIHYEFDRL